MLASEFQALEAAAKADWQPMETCPLERRVLLWWIGGSKLPKAPPSCAMGALSAFEDGMIWTGGQYISKEFYTHWAAMPRGPLTPEPSHQADGAEK